MMYSVYSRYYALPAWGAFNVAAVSLLILIAIIALKGLALWTAVKRDEKWWFIAMLVINTAGLLEFVYLVFFAKIRFDQLLSGNKPKEPTVK